MLKVIGSILVIMSTTLVGFYYSRMFSERLKQIRELQYSLNMLESEIIYSASPLIQAMEYVAERSRAPINEFFRVFSEKLYKKEIEGILEGFQSTMMEFKGKLRLEKDEIDTLASFVKSLESSDLEGQKANFNITMKKLEGFEKRAEESMTKNEKLYKYLGVCSGLLVVIILV
ncbi:stage III sporulation protein SpoIIIAB [Clostridium cylindrosporum]|uniref:Stage III sporulation protein AB n=1 Tax=Clostridium cylindrosporum DSM 605 TaxID=1121307 RepID=A0A0J8D5A9_CLOCY|nr:stage III sporulation protein SpoIIIAB [Clostridium cylindrosporum]KMT21340.1 stage III sporulation protein AB [Clostridium cylindrosporum DSM 605]